MLPRVLVADDHLLIAEGICRLIEKDCLVVGVAATGTEAVFAARERTPDLVLLDLTMPLLNGLEACRRIKAEAPGVKVVFVTMQVRREFVHEAFRAGASGYVLKQAAATDLIDAIKQVQQGKLFLSPMLSDMLPLPAVGQSRADGETLYFLTPRQREVLQLVGESKTAKQIGALLGISVKTVEFHKKHLMAQLRVHSSGELIRYALQRGLVS